MKKAVFILICCFILFFCASCSANTPEKTVKKYFSALNRLEFAQAGELLGNADIYDDLIGKMQKSDSYFESTVNNNFVSFIYSNVKCEIVSVSKSGTYCEAKLKITSYNVNDVIEAQQNMINEYTASSEYLALNTGERYIRLCDRVDAVYKDMAKMVQPAVTEVTVGLIKQNGQWSILPTKELFTALAGGAE